MKKRFIFLTFFILIAFAGVSYACVQDEFGVPPCAFWTRADVVFLGKVLKVENASKSEDLPDGARKVRFQVQQNFKGADNPTFSVVVTDGNLTIKSNQIWIIYANNDIVVKSFAVFRSIKIEPKIPSGELETLKTIIDGKNVMAISGQITSEKSAKYSFEEAEITVTGKNYKQTAKTDANGAFSFPVPSDGKYKVEIKLPFAASLVWDDRLLGTSLAEGDPTVFKYDVSLNDGDCVYSFFEVLKK